MDIIHVPGSDGWRNGYEFGTALDRLWPDQDALDFAIALSEHPDHGADLSSGIKKLHCTQYGENDGAHWIWVVDTEDGRSWRFDGWCDYTGWDCQSDLEATEIIEATAAPGSGAVMERPFIIESDEEPLYWSNIDGWVDLASADRFSEEEMNAYRLPFHGWWKVDPTGPDE